MRILQIITLSELGGAQSVVINLANKLQKDHEVIVVAGEGDGKMWTMLNEGVRKVYIKSLKRAFSPIADLLTVFVFVYLYNKYKPDIIHLHSSKVGILGRLFFPSQKVIYTVHGFDSVRVAYRKYLPLEKFLQNRCKAIVGVSDYDRKNLLKEGITNNVIRIFNGIPKRDKAYEIKNVSTYSRKILCIARISKPKRFDLFLETARLLPQYSFIWIGNKEEIKDLPNNVSCLGNIPNAGMYNKDIDIFMLPSNYEGLPIVILEAMSFGKPVVASDVGGISEVVMNDVNGYTVENRAEVFADKISYILENKERYNFFSENAIKKFENDLTVDKMVDEYIKLYNAGES